MVCFAHIDHQHSISNAKDITRLINHTDLTENQSVQYRNVYSGMTLSSKICSKIVKILRSKNYTPLQNSLPVFETVQRIEPKGKIEEKNEAIASEMSGKIFRGCIFFITKISSELQVTFGCDYCQSVFLFLFANFPSIKKREREKAFSQSVMYSLCNTVWGNFSGLKISKMSVVSMLGVVHHL